MGCDYYDCTGLVYTCNLQGENVSGTIELERIRGYRYSSYSDESDDNSFELPDETFTDIYKNNEWLIRRASRIEEYRNLVISDLNENHPEFEKLNDDQVFGMVTEIKKHTWSYWR